MKTEAEIKNRIEELHELAVALNAKENVAKMIELLSGIIALKWVLDDDDDVLETA